MFLFRKISLLALGFAAVLSVAMPAAQVFAQAAQNTQGTPVRPPLNLMTSPLPLNVVTKPGQTVTADLRVKNNGTSPEVLKIELLKFGASGDTGRPQLKDREPQDLYFNWISFSENTFTADPNVWKTVKMTIKAPKEAAFGYYFAVLFSRAVPDKPTGNQSAVEGGVASLVLLNVDAPGARREAQVAELVATQKVYEFLPSKFTVKIHNSGNIHVSPVGSLFIKRGDTQVAALNFNDERGNILPGTNRVFDLSWGDGFPAYVEKGTGKDAKRTLEWDFGKIQKLRFGRYTATLVAVYDDGQRDVPIEAVVSFWVIPWRILGVILLILLFVGAGIWGVMRLLWKNVRRQSTRPPDDDDGPDPNSLAAATKKRTKKVEAPVKPPKPTRVSKPAKPSKQSSRAVVPKSAPVAAPPEPVVYEEAPVAAPKIRKARARVAPTPAPAAKPTPKPMPTAKPTTPKPSAAKRAKAVMAAPSTPTVSPEDETAQKIQQLQSQMAQLAASSTPKPAKKSASRTSKTAASAKPAAKSASKPVKKPKKS